jgi:hypothetical protein
VAPTHLFLFFPKMEIWEFGCGKWHVFLVLFRVDWVMGLIPTLTIWLLPLSLSMLPLPIKGNCSFNDLVLIIHLSVMFLFHLCGSVEQTTLITEKFDLLESANCKFLQKIPMFDG